nr:MAG TPA: hypothetical protein [Caudoviricetes sp.]
MTAWDGSRSRSRRSTSSRLPSLNSISRRCRTWGT